MKSFAGKNLITELGLDKLSSEEQTEVLLRIGNIIYQAVLIRALEAMTDTEKDEFDLYLSHHGENHDAVNDFLMKKLPNYTEIVEEEINRFKQESSEIFNSATR